MSNDQSRLAQWTVPLTFIGVLFYWPVYRILAMGLRGQWISETFTSRTGHIVFFTVWLAMTSTVLSVLVALPSSYMLYRRSFYGQRTLLALITVPFMLPTVVVAISFSSFRAVSPLTAILIAHVFMNYAIAVRIIGGAWRSLDIHVDEAAELDGASGWRTFVSISLPHLRTAIESAGLLIFLYCASSFGIVLVLGHGLVTTIETELYVSATQYLDLPKTSGLAVIQCLVTLSAFLASQRVTQVPLAIDSSGHSDFAPRATRRDLVPGLVTAATVTFLIAVPIVKVLFHAITVDGHISLDNFRHLSTFGARDILSISVASAALNSLRNAIIATAIAVPIGLRVSYLLSRKTLIAKSPTTRAFLDVLFQLPVGISTVVLGFGYLVTFSTGILPLRSSWFVIPLSQALIATPLVIRILYPTLVSLDNNLVEAAEIDRATNRQIWTSIELPMVMRSLRTAVGFTALVSLGEFGTASFLAYGDQGTLPTVLYQLISRPGPQNYGMAMATSVVLIAIAGAVVFLASAQTRND